MKPLHPIAAMRTLPRRARLAALQAALRHCDAHERALLLVEAAELAIPDSGRFATPVRRDLADRAITLCLSIWPELDGPSRGLLHALGSERLHRAAAELAERAEARERMAALAFAADRLDEGDGASAAVLGRALSDPLTSLADLAERALMRALLRTREAILGAGRDEHGDVGAGAGVREHVAEAVKHGVTTYATHKRRGILMGGLLVLGSPGAPGPARGRLREALRDPEAPEGAALRSVLRASTSPLMREVAWRGLTCDEIGASALDRVSRAATREEHEALLRAMHLALNPRRRARAAMLSVRAGQGRGSCLPAPEDVPALAPEARVGLLRAIDIVECEAPARRSLRTAFLGDPSPFVRACAVATSNPDELLDFAFDASPTVARSAAWRWSLAGAGWQRGGATPTALRPLRALARSPHAVVRAAAREELDRSDPGAVDGRPALALFALARSAPEKARDWLVSMLAPAGGELRVRAAGWAARLPAEAFPLEAMLSAAGDEDPRVAASALLALGSSATPDARAAVIAGLNHPDGRARANAIEALARLARRADIAQGLAGTAQTSPEAAMIWELRDDPGARARANALRAAWGTGDEAATEGLLAMLRDDRADHRLSGAWCVGRVLAAPATGPHALALHARLVELGRTDPDEAVRARARRTATFVRAVRGEARTPLEARP